MVIKNIWTKTNDWLKSQKIPKLADFRPHVDDRGLITQDAEFKEQPADENITENNQAIVKTVPSSDKLESIEKLQEGFNKLVSQLQGINENLNRQISQHEELMDHMQKLPELVESFPDVVKNQGNLTEQLLEQLNATTTKQHQFVDAVEKIPTETAKQTDALTGIDHQLAAAAEADAQMAESFNKFNETLDNLNQSTKGQTDGVLQMSKTFATSDRYLKYLISRQNKRFMWIFMTALGVCVAAILILTGIILYLKQ